MQIDNPALRLRQTPPLCAEDETLKVSASGGVVLTSKPAMDVVSVQQRPDMVSPCPRCQSLDTKFCYFNNHNVKQPRHFCRRCQRYWTAGGALRNVPVGAGRRKHKTPLISTASNLSHPEENALVGAAAGMCYSSSKTAHVLLTPPHTDGAQPHSCESVAAMSAHVGTDARQKEGNLGSLGHHTGAFYGVRRGAGQFKHSEEASSTNALPGSYNEKAVNQVALKSTPSPSPSHRSLDIEKMGLESSASTPLATDQRMGIAHPLGWLEQLGKANPTVPSESMQRAYGNASLSAWNHPLMWPWLMPYAAPTNGPMCNNMDQAMASAAWACAVTATAANILQTSPLWNPYGWGRDVNKSEISSLGKHGRSSLQEQEPLRVPKTLKIGDPDEAMHSSILTTLGLSSLSASSSASVTGFFNTSLEPKPAVWQHKLMVELPQHRHCEPPRVHGNPAAQARSLVFQESS